MMNNAIEHSKAKNIIIRVSQNKSMTRVVIQDDGIGIFENIASYYDVFDLDDAVLTLHKGKLSTDAETHSGKGIFFTSKIMDAFYEISNGKIFKKFNQNGKFDDVESEEATKTSGTKTIMILSNASMTNLTEVFNSYTLNNDFNITEIPMIAFAPDGYPMSRSEARRLCFGFENFEKVILDFEGIKLIGQGFSHEIFTVFRNNNPNVEIEYKNANDDVLMMIKHGSSGFANNQTTKEQPHGRY